MTWGKLFLVLGNSGVGKTTVINCVLNKLPKLEFIPSFTTRNPRKNEKDGVDYIFVSYDYFEKLIKSNELLEFDQPHGTYYYGISKKPIVEQLKKGTSVIRTIAIKGLDQVVNSEFRKHIISIFVLADDKFDIRSKLQERDGEVSQERILQAELELDYADRCDYKIKSIEGNPDNACMDLEDIIITELKK